MNFRIECRALNLSNQEQIDNIVDELTRFSQTQVASITRDYLLTRARKYNMLALLWSDQSPDAELAGFGFAHVQEFSIGVKLPWIHYGLMIIDKSFRERRASTQLARSIVSNVCQQRRLRMSMTGVLLTAKCSSPISFMRLHLGSFRTGFPRIKTGARFDFLTRSLPMRLLSRRISQALGAEATDDFLIRDVNKKSGFSLEREIYWAHTPYQDRVIDYFHRHVLPDNELLFVTWCPSVGLWM
jgi:hypothetical protein